MRRSVFFYAIALAAIMSALVVLTNVIFPDPSESDDEYTWLYLLLYSALFLLFALGGFIAAERKDPLRTGALGGAVTALIVIGTTLLTFIVIDNLFLDIVSQQIDKINAFHNQSTYTNMRDYINGSLVAGLSFGLIGAVVFGGLFGLMGGAARSLLTTRRATS
jgi:hypothetical protein